MKPRRSIENKKEYENILRDEASSVLINLTYGRGWRGDVRILFLASATIPLRKKADADSNLYTVVV